MVGPGELFVGATMGAVVAELLKAVLDAKEKASNFKPMFERLVSTLNSIIPRLDEIDRFNRKIGNRQHDMRELKVLVDNGKALVIKCSKVYRIDYIKKVRYWNELSDLDNSLKSYFITLLPLDQFKNGLETLILVKELHLKLVADESSGKHKESPATRVEQDSENEKKMYQAKAGKKLFLLKGCPYDLDLGDLESYDLVSKGTYVTSYWCSTRHGDVLVKSINLEVLVRKSEFEQRMEDIGKIRKHPNIMLPFGYVSSETANFLLYEYVPAGSLYELLKEPKSLGTRAYWDRSLKIILGTARGISHIHSEGGIHGNIKSSNVLLTRDLNGCISDFSLTPIMNYPANETKEATQESDVYNFGIMLMDIIDPFDVHLLWHPKVFKEQLKIGYIGLKCTDKHPDRRPKMDKVVRMIQDVQAIPSDDETLPFL